MSQHITAADAAAALLRRRSIRNDFIAWARYNGFKPAAHHRLLISKLQALSEGKIRRLAIFMPPGSAKSTYASILFPAFFLAGNPTAQVLGAAHTTELAKRWARRVRNLISDHDMVLGINLSEEAAADRWRLQQGGEYKACGVGTGIAGFRADCVVGDTLVINTNGCQQTVDSLKVHDKILCYGRSQRPEYRRVLAIAGRKTNDIWRIRTASGHIVEATRQHPFYTARGWQSAATLGVGDVLLRVVPKTDAPTLERDCKAEQPSAPRRVLQSHMFDICSQYRTRSCCQRMQCLWQAVVVKAKNWNRRSPVFSAVQIGSTKAGWLKASDSQSALLRSLQQELQTIYEYLSQSLLLFALPRRVAVATNGAGEQYELAAWQRSQPLSERQWSEIQSCQKSGVDERQELLRDVRCPEGLARAPYRRRQHEQRSLERCDAVRDVPLQIAWSGTYATAQDFVVMVERLRRETIVYDIQVEQAQCFFANGILVHNCIIVDDPLRSYEDADSKLIRDRQWDWFKADVQPRAKPDARYCLIQTRWHEDDLAGRIIDEMNHGGDQWEILSLPAEAEVDDPLGRQPGEFLWGDDDYGYANLLREQKATQVPRNWSALYQQRPTPESGDYFKAEWLKPYERAPARETMHIYGASDYATKQDAGDFTCHIVVGIDPTDAIYVLDLWRAQTTPDQWAAIFCDLVREWKPLDWAEEGGQIKTAVGPFLEQMQRERKAYVNREPFPTKGDKSQRAQAIRGRMAQNGLYVPIHAPWYAEFRAELLSFPAGRHDDQVDALGLIGQLLDRMVRGTTPRAEIKIVRDGYYEKSTDDDLSTLGL